MTDDELHRNITDELLWDPRVVDSDDIEVCVRHGTVALTGSVGSYRQKREAQKAAERVQGVVSVDNRLDVEPDVPYRRDDADLRADVLDALMLDAMVPRTVGAHVDDGVVTLTGTAAWQYQRDEAAFVAGNVPGLTGLRNEILLVGPQPNARHVKYAIEQALQRHATLDARGIGVDTDNGTVTLTGTVRSWLEHDAALAAAWAAPGVVDVDDRIGVRP